MSIFSQKIREAFSYEGFLRSFNSSLGTPLQIYLLQVYFCLAMSTLAAGAGALFHLSTNILSGNLLTLLPTSFAAVGFLVALFATPYESGKNVKTRIGLIFGFSFFTGHGLGPLLGIIININLLIVARAFFATTLIVAGFGLVCGACALLMFPRAQYLFLGGPLLSLLFYLITSLLCYYFNGEMILFYFYLYVVFAVVCGFLLYDTHRIIEKHRLGDDYESLSTALFGIVFVDIFRLFLSKKMMDDEMKLLV